MQLFDVVNRIFDLVQIDGCDLLIRHLEVIDQDGDLDLCPAVADGLAYLRIRHTADILHYIPQFPCPVAHVAVGLLG